VGSKRAKSSPYVRGVVSRMALLTRRQVAELLGVTVHCVEKWAERKTGPKFYRTSRFAQGRAAYRIEDVEDFLRQHRIDGSPSLSASAISFKCGTENHE
jgi:hypothetical protein